MMNGSSGQPTDQQKNNFHEIPKEVVLSFDFDFIIPDTE
jgi:hypothetical protein